MRYRIQKRGLCWSAVALSFSLLGCDLRVNQEAKKAKAQANVELAKRERALVAREDSLKQKAAALEVQRQVLTGELVKLSREKMKSVVQDVESEIDLEKTIRTRIQAVQNRVREKMRGRSLLDHDLGDYGQLLRVSARKAFDDKDFITSLAHYSELLDFIDALKMNADFIEKKLLRVNQFYKTKTLTEANKRDAQMMLLNASEALRNKQFKEANHYLNQLFLLLSAKQRETHRG